MPNTLPRPIRPESEDTGAWRRRFSESAPDLVRNEVIKQMPHWSHHVADRTLGAVMILCFAHFVTLGIMQVGYGVGLMFTVLGGVEAAVHVVRHRRS